jgi:hypothetical protein
MVDLKIEWGQGVLKTVQENGFQMDHDILYWSLFMGEPFLINNEWVGYYDGERLLIYTISIYDNIIIPDLLSIEIVKHFISNYTLCYIEFWGDDIPTPFLIEGWFNKFYDTGNDYIGMQIDLFEFNINEKRIKRRIKEYQRRNYTIEVVSRKYFEVEHYNLIREFINTHELVEFDVTYMAYIDFFLNSEYAKIIEVRNLSNNLIGFATINMYLKKCPILVHNFISRDYANVSDAIYHRLITETLSQKIQILDLGYSMHKSLKEYKLNWGANKLRGSVKGMQFFQQSAYIEGYLHWWSFELKKYYDGIK